MRSRSSLRGKHHAETGPSPRRRRAHEAQRKWNIAGVSWHAWNASEGLKQTVVSTQLPSSAKPTALLLSAAFLMLPMLLSHIKLDVAFRHPAGLCVGLPPPPEL